MNCVGNKKRFMQITFSSVGCRRKLLGEGVNCGLQPPPPPRVLENCLYRPKTKNYTILKHPRGMSSQKSQPSPNPFRIRSSMLKQFGLRAYYFINPFQKALTCVRHCFSLCFYKYYIILFPSNKKICKYLILKSTVSMLYVNFTFT